MVEWVLKIEITWHVNKFKSIKENTKKVHIIFIGGIFFY